MHHAPVPRNLRVNASVQVAGQRLPARGFLVVASVILLAGVAVVLGADVERAVWAAGVAALAGLVLVEGRLWGRSTREVARIATRHALRGGLLRRTPVVRSLPPLPSEAPMPARRPRWMEGDHARP